MVKDEFILIMYEYFHSLPRRLQYSLFSFLSNNISGCISCIFRIILRNYIFSLISCFFSSSRISLISSGFFNSSFSSWCIPLIFIGLSFLFSSFCIFCIGSIIYSLIFTVFLRVCSFSIYLFFLKLSFFLANSVIFFSFLTRAWVKSCLIIGKWS